MHYAKPLQSYPALCDPMDNSPPGSSVHAILQAGTLEWVDSKYVHFFLKLFCRVRLFAIPLC